MSKFTRKKVVSNRAAISDMTREHFRIRYQCFSENADVLRALVAHQLPKKTDLAVRVHVWNCERCRSEYLKLKAEPVVEVASPVLDLPAPGQTISSEDADFRELLKQLLSGLQSIDALLIAPVFQRRLQGICQCFARNAVDADELANQVRWRVFERLNRFEPNYEQPYGNFFSWVNRIARHTAIDDFQRKSLRQNDSLVEEAYAIQDVKVNVEAEAERREAIERFWGFVGRFDNVTQKIMHCHLKDYSLREIQEKLATEGIKLSHVAIGDLVQRVVADFLASEDARIAAMITRKGEYLSGDRKIGGPSARKTGS